MLKHINGFKNQELKEVKIIKELCIIMKLNGVKNLKAVIQIMKIINKILQLKIMNNLLKMFI
jgi:hypothetical protein